MNKGDMFRELQQEGTLPSRVVRVVNYYKTDEACQMLLDQMDTDTSARFQTTEVLPSRYFWTGLWGACGLAIFGFGLGFILSFITVLIILAIVHHRDAKRALHIVSLKQQFATSLVRARFPEMFDDPDYKCTGRTAPPFHGLGG